MSLTTSTAGPSLDAAAAPDLSPLRASVGRFHDWQPLRIEGVLPSGLRGALVRAGPGLMERFGHRLVHAFEADGALIGLRLAGDGAAEGCVRVVEGPGYRAEEAARRPLFGSAAPWWRRFANGLRQRVKETGNTAVLRWQDRAFALMEGSRPVEFDPTSLHTLGVSDLGGALGPTFSAHPHRVATKGVTYNFGQRHGPRPTIDLYALPDRGPARRLGEVAVPFNTMIHDFAVTERTLVFVLSALRLNLGRALLAPRDMTSLMEWHPEGASVLLVPVDAIDAPVRIPIAPRFVFHLANAYERGDEVVVDVLQYADLSVMKALSRRGQEAEPSPPQLQRLVVAPGERSLRADARLWDQPCEFPVVPAARVGAPYSELWLITGDEGRSSGLARLNVETLAVDRWAPGAGIVPSEGVFVEDPEAPGGARGWLISLVFDAWVGASYWAVLDSERLSAGPIAKLWMDQALPQTFHGTWMPRG